MQNQIVILAGDYREGRRFAADIGLGMGAVVPVDASRLNGIAPTVILELPSYATRRDRFAMEAVLQRSYAKIGRPVIEMFIEDPLEFRPAAPAADDASVAKPEPLPGDQVPGQTTVDEQVALAAADRITRVAAIDRTAPATSVEQAVADSPKTPDAVTPTKTGYKPRSRKRS
jgi:hypothetical protein